MEIRQVYRNGSAMFDSLDMCTVYTNEFTFELKLTLHGPLSFIPYFINIGLLHYYICSYFFYNLYINPTCLLRPIENQ